MAKKQINSLKQLRLQAGKTQLQVGKKMKIHYASVSEFENNHITQCRIKNLIRYAKAVGVSGIKIEFEFKGKQNRVLNLKMK